jgi:Flp pilus assembly protein protease CpaA
MHCVALSILTWIALVDLRTHRITNRAVLVLAIASLVTTDLNRYTWFDHIYTTIIVLFIAIILSISCGLGMGDVKLLGTLAIFILPTQADTYVIFLLTVAVAASAHTIFLSGGVLRKSLQIPLAPAILCGTIATLIAK